MFRNYSSSHLYIFILIAAALFLSGCIKVKDNQSAPTLLKSEDATQDQLLAEVNRFASVGSMRAKMDLKFEDNSFAQFGSKEVYRSADGEIVVQRPANISMKVQVPVIGTNVAQMTSDGTRFRVAILQDGGSGKYKKFVIGSNNADYSKLQASLDNLNGDALAAKSVNAFANLRPQHFTDAMLVRPTDENHLYTQSTIFQLEIDDTHAKKSPLHKVTRGYYLLDEFAKNPTGQLVISRRFWFDRVGGIRLARQQIFDTHGEIESDIVYGAEGTLTNTGSYARMPLQIIVTRPQEKYSMKLTYQAPEAVTIGKTYPASAFLLENTWELEEVDLDKKLQEALAARPTSTTTPATATNSNTATTRFQ
jgi:outer membrane murein-binding lipoprotein Lpp